MYTFGDFRNRKQKHPNVYIPGDYLLLGSEPAASSEPKCDEPSFTFVNYYLTKHRVLRNMRRLRREQIG